MSCEFDFLDIKTWATVRWQVYRIKTFVVFGLTISIYFKFFRNSGELTVNKICFWILSSAIAYNSAVGVVLFYVTVTKSLSDSMTLPLFFAGMVGGGLMLVGYHYFLFPLKVRELLVLTVFAGILGVLFRESTNMFINLYVVWQLGMSLALGALMDRSRNSESTAEFGQQEVKPKENITQ